MVESRIPPNLTLLPPCSGEKPLLPTARPASSSRFPGAESGRAPTRRRDNASLLPAGVPPPRPGLGLGLRAPPAPPRPVPPRPRRRQPLTRDPAGRQRGRRSRRRRRGRPGWVTAPLLPEPSHSLTQTNKMAAAALPAAQTRRSNRQDVYC